MTTLADFNFVDGYELSYYDLEVSDIFPLWAQFEINTLILDTHPYSGGELIINIEGEWAEETPASILLRNAQGKASIQASEINSPSPEDIEAQAKIRCSPERDGGYMILSLRPHERFQFTGYKIEINSLI